MDDGQRLAGGKETQQRDNIKRSGLEQRCEIMYYIDTKTNNVDAYDYDIASGAIVNRRAVVKNIWGGYFDGMTIDKDGNLYVAIWDGGWCAENQSRERCASGKNSCARCQECHLPNFRRQNMNELFITSSADGADETAEPNAGALFHIELADAQGWPAFEFAG